MKSYFLPIGEAAERALPTVFSALTCGITKEVPELFVLRILSSAPASLNDALIADLNECQRLFAGSGGIAFFRTRYTSVTMRPVLPPQRELAESGASGLLLAALRGKNMPLSYRTDREAVEWAFSSLLDAEADSVKPLLLLRDRLLREHAAGEELRITVLCNLPDAFSVGAAAAVLRFLRSAFPAGAPFLGVLLWGETGSGDLRSQLGDARDALTAFADRNLIRPADDRPTAGADAAWLLSLPSSLTGSPDAWRVVHMASARVLAEISTQSARPTAGLHTRELPGTLTLSALGAEAKPAAAFLRAAVWCLCDLFPSLRQFFEHPVLLRSLAPATRNGLFRRLFRNPENSSAPADFAILERVVKVILLNILSLLRTLPNSLREPDIGRLWQEAVRACGRAVTVAAEYDVSRREAADSGIDKVAPVHRVSMADTEEEEQLRKLDRMAEDLAEAVAARTNVFEQIGGFRARQALADCLSRCRIAEVSAREKLALLPVDSPENRYAYGLQERRVRRLQAAVARCEADLKKSIELRTLSAPGTARPASPFAGAIVDPALAEQCFALLTLPEGETLEQRSSLRDHISELLSGSPLSDSRTLLRSLLSACRQPEPDAPLRALMAGVFSVCGVEVSGLKFQSAGEQPEVPLLPDLDVEDRFLTMSGAASHLLAPAGRDQTAEKRGLLAMLMLREYRRRGAEEASLVMDRCVPEDSALARVYLSSRGTKEAWIVSLRKEEADGSPSVKLPFAILLPGRGVECAYLSAAHAALVPPFAVWFHADELRFEDPCVYFSEGDRRILTELFTRLRAALSGPAAHAFTDFLADWHRDAVQAHRPDREDAMFVSRLKTACALSRLPAWQGEIRRLSAVYEHALREDRLCARLLPSPASFDAAGTKVPDDILYTFRGMPFARESADRLLESPGLPEEAHLLSSLNAECEILARSSDDYHDALIEGLTDLLRRYPNADPNVRETAEDLIRESREPIRDPITELRWPWDTVSASVLTVLQECLGPELGRAALHPFSDMLTVFPARGGEIIGDALLSRACSLAPAGAQAYAGTAALQPVAGETNASAAAAVPGMSPEAPISGMPAPEVPGAGAAAAETAEPTVPADAVLPPLSAAFCEMLCRSSEGRTLLEPGLLRFERESGQITALLTLEGAFTLRLIRTYGEEEILSLYAHDMPTLALWPSIPFPEGSWQAYFVFAHWTEGFRVTAAAQDGKEYSLSGAAPRAVQAMNSFPVSFSFWQEDRCIGSLPNLLPVPQAAPTGVWTACVDFGSSGTSVVFASAGMRAPLRGPGMVRLLVRHPAASAGLLWREFMPSIPVSAILPGALRIFRNAPNSSLSRADGGDAPEGSLPFRDGSILLSASLRDVLDVPPETLYTDLKWNGEKGRAAGMYLHQVMLLSALQARSEGAEALNWRAAVPDGMAPEGREALVRMFDSLARQVSRESGLPFPGKSDPVSFASESSALGAYFRLCSPEETRGGFLLLDLGADTADISLFLRGRESAVRAVQLPLGIHYMLLPTFLQLPDALLDDFSFVQDPLFLRDLNDLCALLRASRNDSGALRQVRYAIDAFLADHMPLIFSALGTRMMSGAPARTGALLLLCFAWLMMLSGLILLQISSDPGRNDFIPEQMSLCLSGRGAGLIEALSDPAKASLWRFLTMFRNPRVSSLSLLFSAEKKLEIPVGLSCLNDVRPGVPAAASVPVTIQLKPEELIPEFLTRFRREFPMEADLLLPGVYSGDPYAPFTPHGRMLIAEAMSEAFGGQEVPRPYNALAAFPGQLLERAREQAPPVGPAPESGPQGFGAMPQAPYAPEFDPNPQGGNPPWNS